MLWFLGRSSFPKHPAPTTPEPFANLNCYAVMEIIIPLLIGLAAIAIVWWAINALGLPQPVRIIAVVVIALICLGWLIDYGPRLSHLH